MNHSETKKLVVTTGVPSANVFAERVSLVNEAGQPISTKTDAELNSRYAPKVAVTVDAAGGGDYTTLAAVIAAYPSGGVEILVKRGTYLTTSNLILPSNTWLTGEGDASILKLEANTNQNVINTAVSSSNIRISNLLIDGNKANNTDLTNGIAMFGSNATVTNVHVKNVTGYGIVAFPGATDCVIVGNIVEGSGKEGIELQGASRGTIANNLVTSAGYTGIYVWANTAAGGTISNVSITGNIVTGHGAAVAASGIRVDDGATKVTVSGNIIANATTANSYGIGVWSGTSTALADVTVTGNVVTGANHAAGIYVGKSSAITVTGNNVSATVVGIQVISTASNVTINANTVTSTSGNGVIASSCTGIIASHNHVTSCGGTTNDAMKFDGVTSLAVIGNRVTLAGTDGIYIAAGTSEFTVSGNVLTLNRDSGILVLDASHGTVTGNVCRSNGTKNTGSSLANGITLYKLNTACTDIIVSANRCYDSQGSKTQLYGIRMVGATDTIEFAGNLLAGNSTAGLLVSGTDTNTASVPYRKITATVGASPATVAHGLGYIPLAIAITMTSAGTIWRSASSDATNIYLTADSAGRTCDVLVG